MFTEMLIQETKEFLKGTKLAESLSNELAQILYCPIILSNGEKLENILASALLNKRDVLIAGTAGGGKTMLLNQILNVIEKNDEIKNKILILDELDDADLAELNYRPDILIVVKDLTAIDPKKVYDILVNKKRGNYIIAANEGALLVEDLNGYFKNSINSLHLLQSGIDVKNEDEPVLIDMAAIDPISFALSSLLTNPLIHKAVEEIENDKGFQNSVRIKALSQLENEKLAKDIALLIRSSLGPGEITFRELWNFISDIFLEGENESLPPTSVWFWRVFYGNSRISNLIRDSLQPKFLSFPQESFSMYQGDLQALNLSDKIVPLWIHPGANPIDCDESEIKIKLMQWIRIQFALLDRLFDKSDHNIFIGSFSTSLYTKVINNFEKVALIQALNSYFRRKIPSDSDATELELWTDLMVERRENRSLGSVSLGTIAASQLQITKSKATANFQSLNLDGCKVFLKTVKETSNRVLGFEITGKFFRSISRGRPNSHYDRNNDDTELAIKKFYYQLSKTVKIEQNDIISVLETPHDSLSKEFKWKINKPLSKLGH